MKKFNFKDAVKNLYKVYTGKVKEIAGKFYNAIMALCKKHNIPYYRKFKRYNLHITTNSKVGNEIITINLLAGNGIECHRKGDGTLLTDVPGTCPMNCPGCYALRDEMRYHNTNIKSHVENTIFARENLSGFMTAIYKWLLEHPEKKIIRWHATGEIETYEYFAYMVLLAKMLPDRIFYVYTKMFDIVNSYVANNGNNKDLAIPGNFTINFSYWHEHGLNNNPYGFPFYAYDDHDEKYNYNDTWHCIAYDRDGNLNKKATCGKCGACFSGKNFKHEKACHAH